MRSQPIRPPHRSAGAFVLIFALAVRPHGKLVAAGRAFTGTSDDYALVRYERNGSLDRSFGSRGEVTPTSTSASTRPWT